MRSNQHTARRVVVHLSYPMTLVFRLTLLVINSDSYHLCVLYGKVTETKADLGREGIRTRVAEGCGKGFWSPGPDGEDTAVTSLKTW